MTIRIVDIQEMCYLNWYYSNKNFPTNVLSFPFSSPVGIQSFLIGDIVICRQVVEYEMQQFNIFYYVHWAHMIIHGLLHLLGYTHISKKESILMKKLEKKMMKKIGYKMYHNSFKY